MEPPTHTVEAFDLELACNGCNGPCRAGDLTRLGICPDCHGVRACKHCGTVMQLDATGHCEWCCEGVFVPADAHADLAALADATFALMVAESGAPALDALPWEPWCGVETYGAAA